MTDKQVVLKPGRERSVLRGHPWVFSGAAAAVRGEPAPGETVAVLDATGTLLGRAAYSPESQIRARMWTFDPQERVDGDFFRRQLRTSFALRERFRPLAASNSFRLCHAESDGLPGVVVDQYGEVLVLQLLSWGAEMWRDTLVEVLLEITGVRGMVERSDADVRSLEGLPERTGVLYGADVPPVVDVLENGCRFRVELLAGHKTGFYLDQRANRQRVRLAAKGLDVLDGFCYTGGFGIQALAGGAREVTFLDSSEPAMAQVASNLKLNDLQTDQAVLRAGDVFQVLRQMRDEGRSYDLIVLDPPKFAPTRAHAEKAARAYKDINLLAFKLLRPGGLLHTFSCSGGVDAALFQKIVAGAAADAGAIIQVLGWLTQDWDHPVALHFPEGNYLKGLVCHKRS